MLETQFHCSRQIKTPEFLFFCLSVTNKYRGCSRHLEIKKKNSFPNMRVRPVISNESMKPTHLNPSSGHLPGNKQRNYMVMAPQKLDIHYFHYRDPHRPWVRIFSQRCKAVPKITPMWGHMMMMIWLVHHGTYPLFKYILKFYLSGISSHRKMDHHIDIIILT